VVLRANERWSDHLVGQLTLAPVDSNHILAVKVRCPAVEGRGSDELLAESAGIEPARPFGLVALAPRRKWLRGCQTGFHRRAPDLGLAPGQRNPLIILQRAGGRIDNAFDGHFLQSASASRTDEDRMTKTE
jgi:hypothetical protein